MLDLSKIDLSSVLSDDFLKNNTPFGSFSEFSSKLNIDLSNGIGDELESINAFIKEHTNFSDLAAMVTKATSEGAGGLLDKIKGLF